MGKDFVHPAFPGGKNENLALHRVLLVIITDLTQTDKNFPCPHKNIPPPGLPAAALRDVYQFKKSRSFLERLG
jgi:hypothetical protein